MEKAKKYVKCAPHKIILLNYINIRNIMNKFKIIMYLGVGIMLFHLVAGLSEKKYDFSILGALLVVIGYLKYELWYIIYALLVFLIIIEFYNDVVFMVSFPSKQNKNIPTKNIPTTTPVSTENAK